MPTTPSPSLQALLDARKATNHMTVEAAVQAQGQARFEHGKEKYGVTIDRTDLTLLEWLQHFKEEALDAVRYAERAQRILEETNMVEVQA